MFSFFFSCKEYEEYLVLHLINFLHVQKKTETVKLSSEISISEGFSILVLLLDKLVLEIDLNLFTMFSVSVL